MRSTYTADEFLKTVLPRMQAYVNQSIPAAPQLRKGERLMEERGAQRVQVYKALGNYFATINLSSGPRWNFELKTSPHPQGRATRVVYTEYDLPRAVIQPHDVIVDAEGIAWYSSFGEQKLGRLDPRTGAVREFDLPIAKPEFPTGVLALRNDRDWNPWVGNMYQASIARFDRKTETFKIFTPPKEDNLSSTAPYDVVLDKTENAWTGAMTTDRVARLDVKTGGFTEYLLPRSTNIRRVYVDNSTTLVTFWVGNNHGASIVKLEPMD